MIRFIGKHGSELAYYATHFQPGCLDSLPWKDEECDCLVWVQDSNATDECLREVAFALARMKNDWVMVAGQQCQELHDRIDQAAVDIGRQQRVGDGLPMTSWHDEVRTIPELSELARLPLGGSNYLLVIVVGSESEFEMVVPAIRDRLLSTSERRNEFREE